VEQFLEIGAPCEISDPNYLAQISHDEHRIRFGGPYGTDGEVAFQRLESTLKKEEEQCESNRLEVEVEELMELLDSDDDAYDQFSYKASITELELRIARLRKEPVGSNWHCDLMAYGPDEPAIYGLYWPGSSDEWLYHATQIWPTVAGFSLVALWLT
jgi:hypothetical protein